MYSKGRRQRKKSDEAGIALKLVDFRFRIDWPRGRLGYLPWNRIERTYGINDKRHKPRARKFMVKVDLGKNWKVAEFEGRHGKRSQWKEFVGNLIDTVVHETVHAFQPKGMLERVAEREASQFAMYARQTGL